MRQVTLAEVPKVLSDDFAASYATDEEQTNGELLRRILEAVAAGRFDELRGWMAPDVSLELAAAPRFPFVRRAEGVDAVIEAIAHNFSTVAGQMPEPLAVVAQGDTVMVMARETGRLVETGERYALLLAHQFTFREGRLVLSRSVSAETAE
jgi:ketosteroid isomerase-like protein